MEANSNDQVDGSATGSGGRQVGANTRQNNDTSSGPGRIAGEKKTGAPPCGVERQMESRLIRT